MKRYGLTEPERLAQKLYDATIRERELTHTLRLTQNAAQTPSHKPVPPQRPAQPKPTTQPAQPQTQPEPQRPTAPPLYQSSASMAVFNWQEASYTCIICARATMSWQLVEECLQEGKAQQESVSLGKRTWLSRVDRCEERCSVCQRKIS